MRPGDGLAAVINGRWKRLTVTGIAAIAGCGVLLTLINAPGSPLARLPGTERLATLMHTDEGASAARLTIWRTALPLIAAATNSPPAR